MGNHKLHPYLSSPNDSIGNLVQMTENRMPDKDFGNDSMGGLSFRLHD